MADFNYDAALQEAFDVRPKEFAEEVNDWMHPSQLPAIKDLNCAVCSGKARISLPKMELADPDERRAIEWRKCQKTTDKNEIVGCGGYIYNLTEQGVAKRDLYASYDPLSIERKPVAWTPTPKTWRSTAVDVENPTNKVEVKSEDAMTRSQRLWQQMEEAAAQQVEEFFIANSF